VDNSRSGCLALPWAGVAVALRLLDFLVDDKVTIHADEGTVDLRSGGRSIAL